MPDATGTANTPVVSPSGGSASAQEAARLAGAEDDRPKGKDRGAEIAKDAPPVPKHGDFAGGPATKPVGDQAEPAFFTPTGTIPPNMGPSPAGLVPESVAVLTSDESKKQSNPGRLEDHELTEAEVEQLSGADLRALAVQRGYTTFNQLAGSRTTRRQFLAAQAKDESFGGGKSPKSKTT